MPQSDSVEQPLTNDPNPDSILEILSEDDSVAEEKPVKKTTSTAVEDDILPDTEVELEDEEEKVEDDKEEDDLEKIEQDLEDEEKLKDIEEDENIEELVAPVKRSQILAKYPKLFKDFPYLEKAYFRNLQFTELFSVPKEARDAKEKSEQFDYFDNVLGQGNIEQVLHAVKNGNENAFKKIADDYLLALSKVDKAAANHVTGNVIKLTIRSMIREARETQDDSLEAAATLLNKFFFRTSEIQNPTRLTPEQNEKENDNEKKLRQEREQFQQERYHTAVQDTGAKIENRIKALIDTNIDPKEIMSDYIRSKASEDVYKKVAEVWQSDKQFITLKDKLWKRAFENGYSRESLEAIQSAFISKAKTVLPTVIKKAKIEALRGMGKRVRTESSSKKEEPTETRSSAAPRRILSNSNAQKDRGKSTLDIFNE